MKTTLTIADATFQALREAAVRDRKTISELVETALRAFLERAPGREGRRPAPRLPAFSCGSARVDIDDRATLYDEILSPVAELRNSLRVADASVTRPGADARKGRRRVRR